MLGWQCAQEKYFNGRVKSPKSIISNICMFCLSTNIVLWHTLEWHSIFPQGHEKRPVTSSTLHGTPFNFKWINHRLQNCKATHPKRNKSMFRFLILSSRKTWQPKQKECGNHVQLAILNKASKRDTDKSMESRDSSRLVQFQILVPVRHLTMTGTCHLQNVAFIAIMKDYCVTMPMALHAPIFL